MRLEGRTGHVSGHYATRQGAIALLALVILAGCSASQGTSPAEPAAPAGRELINPDVNYAAASRFGDLVFTAGHLPDGPSADFPSQVASALTNLENTLEDAGAGFDTLLKVNVYLADFDDWDAFNSVYLARIGQYGTPPRTTVEIGRLGNDSPIEIEAIAHVRSGEPDASPDIGN